MSPKRISLLRSVWLPPLPFTLAALLMAGLNRWLPGWRFDALPLRWFGAACALIGLAGGLYAARMFSKADTSLLIFRPPTRLVTSGPYRFTRNPMYLGMVVALLGWMLFLGSVTPLLVVPGFMWVITASIIRFEERRLADLFGDAYLDYCRRVRRWL